jgi:hypothetical protein
MDRVTGSCLCGNVRIVASGPPYRVGLCHCLDCRKHHGSLFHASAVFPQDAVTIDGETRDYAGRFFMKRKFADWKRWTPNPQVGITAAQISRLIETLELLRDQCTAMISSYGREGGIEHIANTRPTSEGE